MEYNTIDKYLFDLRKRGLDYYSKEEILVDYEQLVNSLKVDGYNGIIAEFDFDMEIWYLLESIKGLILSKKDIEQSEKIFLEKFEKIDNELLDITFQIKNAPGLPWWYYRVLKRAGKQYAEDVKTLFGIDVEIIK
jgi:hypothetical protein